METIKSLRNFFKTDEAFNKTFRTVDDFLSILSVLKSGPEIFELYSTGHELNLLMKTTKYTPDSVYSLLSKEVEWSDIRLALLYNINMRLVDNSTSLFSVIRDEFSLFYSFELSLNHGWRMFYAQFGDVGDFMSRKDPTIYRDVYWDYIKKEVEVNFQVAFEIEKIDFDDCFVGAIHYWLWCLVTQGDMSVWSAKQFLYEYEELINENVSTYEDLVSIRNLANNKTKKKILVKTTTTTTTTTRRERRELIMNNEFSSVSSSDSSFESEAEVKPKRAVKRKRVAPQPTPPPPKEVERCEKCVAGVLCDVIVVKGGVSSPCENACEACGEKKKRHHLCKIHRNTTNKNIPSETLVCTLVLRDGTQLRCYHLINVIVRVRNETVDTLTSECCISTNQELNGQKSISILLYMYPLTNTFKIGVVENGACITGTLNELRVLADSSLRETPTRLKSIITKENVFDFSDRQFIKVNGKLSTFKKSSLRYYQSWDTPAGVDFVRGVPPPSVINRYIISVGSLDSTVRFISSAAPFFDHDSSSGGGATGGRRKRGFVAGIAAKEEEEEE